MKTKLKDKCPACDGDGKILKINSSPTTDYLPPSARIIAIVCPTCKGTGLKKKKVKRG